MFSTAEELRTTHSDCEEWEEYNAVRVSEDGEEIDKLETSCCRMFLCCADCGWYTTLSEDGRTISEEGTIAYLKTFFSHHNNEGLLVMLVYFLAKPSDEMTCIRFNVTSMAGGEPTVPCVHCSATFLDPFEANSHYIQKHDGPTLACEECNAGATTKYILEQHQMSHLHENSYFADFLTNSVRIFPPPTNRCDGPRIGWKYRTMRNVIANGGIGYDLIDPQENVKETKARLIDKRRGEGSRNATIREESDMAREVRERLMSKYADCEGMGGFDDPVWLKDEDALKFKEWMDYWESEEGRKNGGPPRRIHVPSLMRIPLVKVELQFTVIDVISGFLLNDNVYYCIECDSIIKGEQAEEHLKQKGSVVNPCSTNVDGSIEEHPAMNDNMYLLYLRSASSPSSSLLCPLCPLKSCSITGLRVHMMVDHRIFVKCNRVTEENDLTVEKERPVDAAAASSLLQPTEAANRRDESSSGEMGESGAVGSKFDKPFAEMEEERLAAAAAAPVEPPTAAKEAEHTDNGVTGDSRDDEVPKSAADASEVSLQRPTAATKRAKPIGDDIPDGEDDEEAVKYVLMKIVHTVVRNEEKERETSENEMIVESSIRVEDTIEGENNERRFKEEIDMDEEGEIIPNQPVIRFFAPEGDDDVCVVAEVENRGCSTAAATINQQREKKFSCPKCSCKFKTRATLAVHMSTDHQFDAGGHMIEEELGIPFATPVWMCMICSLAFPKLELQRLHVNRHTRSKKCDTCSGVAYNEEFMRLHLDREKEKRVGYICGECKIEFSHDTNLHEHNALMHGVVPFFFCKWCDMGSTDSLSIYKHFMMECPRGYTHLAKTYKNKAQDHASKCIGVCPASQLHFQPINLKNYKTIFAEHPDKFVVPSLCNHRSMLVTTEKAVTCYTCRCLESASSHAVFYEMRTGRKWGEIATANCAPPLSVVRRVYDKWKSNETNASTVLPAYGSGLPPSVLFDRAAQGSALNTQQVLHRMGDRMQAAGQPRGEMRRENGEGAGGEGRPISSFSMGNGSQYGGGAGEMRGAPVSTGMGGSSQNGGGAMMLRGPHVSAPTSRANVRQEGEAGEQMSGPTTPSHRILAPAASSLSSSSILPSTANNSLPSPAPPPSNR